MVYLTRRERFNSAHRLFNPNFTDDENYALYGKCANPNWHGHNYELFITVKGLVDANTGMVINLKALSNVVNELVIDKMDHKNLNLEVDFLKDKITSSEMIIKSIWDVLAPAIIELGAELHKLKLTETENNYAEYYGE
jgi:6-pyruvoyltetrahydropterin/6-carboxytetrahydropterin synthase